MKSYCEKHQRRSRQEGTAMSVSRMYGSIRKAGG
jgi:hypothetical protein